ncbi:MAG: hypothetical protein Tsb005_14440 [Gammaproteobacteria bacterium]
MKFNYLKIIWLFFYLNFCHAKSILLWKIKKPKKHQNLLKIIKQLQENGFVKLTLEDIGLDVNYLNYLKKCFTRLSHNPITDEFRDNNNVNKNYWKRLLGNSNILLSLDYLEIVLNKNLLFIINSYLSCYSQLLEFNFWHNEQSIKPNPIASQLWHRDTIITHSGKFSKSTRSIVKVFIFLSDVGPKTGNFHYVTQSNKRNPAIKLEPKTIEISGAIRYSDQQIINTFGSEALNIIEGPPGTILIFDAAGLHKGGHILEGERQIFKMEFGSWLWVKPPYPKLVVNSKKEIYKYCNYHQRQALISILR